MALKAQGCTSLVEEPASPGVRKSRSRQNATDRTIALLIAGEGIPVLVELSASVLCGPSSRNSRHSSVRADFNLRLNFKPCVLS